MADQVPFGDISFAENPEPRCPCVLLLDVSGSMQGEPLRSLQEGLGVYKSELSSDALASKRVEVAVVTFGGAVQTASQFATADSFYPPVLTAGGDTPMGAAIHQGLAMVRDRKNEYRQNGIMFYRPWIFLITDGSPTDEWRAAAAAIREGEASKAFAFFAVGVKGANLDILRELSSRAPLQLDGLRFTDLFQWLSNSQQRVSQSTPGEEVALPNPTGPSGWASI